MDTVYNGDMKQSQTGVPEFRNLIEEDFVYVDKTGYIAKLLQMRRRYYFISRPRRFGKSLFCNTLESLFKGEKELFKGLYIYDKYDFKPYPVLHFDFNNMDADSIEDFIKGLKGKIILQAEEVGIDIDSSYGPAMMFEMLIEKLYRRDGEIVIIQDEYDAPLTSASIGNPEMAEKIRRVLNSFYATIKNKAGMIKFCFITGVVKLSNLSIFSAMNNLVDLSMDKEFSGAFGYTDEELDEYFGEGIDEYLEANPGVYESREEFREKIRSYYDGYRFSPESETKVYNPVSIGFFFNNGCKFDNYWDETAVSTLAVTLARKTELVNVFSNGMLAISSSSFSSFDISQISDDELAEDNVAALLYFTGYLTISDYDNPDITLAFPNTEVASSFTNSLLKRYAKKRCTAFDSWAKGFFNACEDGNDEVLRKKLSEYFDAFSYELIGDEKGKFYHAIFHAIFLLTGVYAIAEDRGLRGRADEVVITSDSLWIFELKVNGSAEDALRQIEDKGYADKYADMIERRKLKVRKVGISLSSETRSIAEWKCIDA